MRQFSARFHPYALRWVLGGQSPTCDRNFMGKAVLLRAVLFVPIALVVVCLHQIIAGYRWGYLVLFNWLLAG